MDRVNVRGTRTVPGCSRGSPVWGVGPEGPLGRLRATVPPGSRGQGRCRWDWAPLGAATVGAGCGQLKKGRGFPQPPSGCRGPTRPRPRPPRLAGAREGFLPPPQPLQLGARTARAPRFTSAFPDTSLAISPAVFPVGCSGSGHPRRPLPQPRT